MTKLDVQVITYGENPAYHHVITGFLMLQRAGVIDLHLQRCTDSRGRHPTPSFLEAVIAGRVRIAYDVEDGYIIDKDARNRYLSTVELCFKRSYNEDCHSSSPFAYKFRPLGLIYEATARSSFLRQRQSLRGHARTTAKRLLGRQVTPHWWRYEDVPRVSPHPVALFAARVWNPQGEKGEDIGDSIAARADRAPLNEMRADCVRLLRRELGKAFVGGLVPTAYALKTYPDCVTTQSVTRRRSFLSQVRKADVCIATRGLFGSNGYKLGEYVAASRAVIGERMLYSVPGNFAEGENYLPFESPEECVDQATRLLHDRGRIYAMQASNYRYYQEYVRPDRMVLNTLTTTVQTVAPDDLSVT